MKKILLLFSLLLTPALTAAANNPTGTTREENFREILTKNEAELYHTLAEKKDVRSPDNSTFLTLSGLIEIEAAAEKLHLKDGNNNAADDLTLATLQFGVTARLTAEFSSNLKLLFEEDVTTFGVDEATFAYAHGPWFARGGRQYLPFGNFRSHLVSDPLTLLLGETRSTAIVAGYQSAHGSGSLFLFDNNNGGASLRMTPVDGVELGASYLVDLGASNAELRPAPSRRQVGGASAFAVLAAGPIELSGEVLGALRPFSAAGLDLDGGGSNDLPLTWNFEAAWALGERVELAARYEGSRDLAGQPQGQFGGAGSWRPREDITLALEYLRGTFARGFDSDRRDLVTAQLALAF